MDKISIVIINWNNTEDTLNCINSIKGNYDIIVVDNGSKEPPKINNVYLILNNTNYGFAAGNNQGIRCAIENLKSDYILLLNSDTITTPNFLEPLISLMHTDPKIGAVQPRLLRYVRGSARPRFRRGTPIIDSAGQIAYKYGSVRDIGIGRPDGPLYQQRREVFGSCAAAVLYRVSALREVGLFDEKLFCLFEDVDMSWRLRLKGYKIMYEPDSVVYHKRGVSGRIRKENKIIRRFYGFRNCLIVTIRYYPIFYIITFMPIHIYRLITALFFKLRYRIKAPLFKFIFSSIKERI